MKVYVLGDNHEHAVRLTNFINSVGNTAIMSEHSSSDYNELVDDMLDNKARGFDLIVAISKQPIETSIETNRNNAFRAAVCKNPKEAATARKAHANVIVLSGNNLDDDVAGDIVEAWLGVSAQGSTEEEAPVPRRMPQLSPDALKNLISFTSPKPSQKKRKSAEKDEEDESDEPPKPKGKGIIEDLKYTFGIE